MTHANYIRTTYVLCTYIQNEINVITIYMYNIYIHISIIMLACGCFVQDLLHGLQRFYHNVDHWGIKLYHHIYIDFITMMIIGVLSFTITPISTFSEAFVIEIQ